MPAAIVAGDTALAEYTALLSDDFASFAGVLLSRAQPAHPVRDELAFRADRRKASGNIPEPDPPTADQRAASHLKSLLASVAFPAWCLGHDPSAQIVCASYAQDLADKLSRDCRHIVTSDGYQRRHCIRRCRSSKQQLRAAGSPPRSAAC